MDGGDNDLIPRGVPQACGVQPALLCQGISVGEGGQVALVLTFRSVEMAQSDSSLRMEVATIPTYVYINMYIYIRSIQKDIDAFMHSEWRGEGVKSLGWFWNS